jgi:predicted PurR-regulated permease PerM
LKDNLNNFDYTIENIQLLANQLTSVPRIVGIIVSAFSSVLYIVSLFAITFYLLLERKQLHHYLKFLFASEAEAKAEKFVGQIEQKIGGWVRGELMLMTIVGVTTFIGLALLRIPFALPLALLAGVLELLPNVGPTVSAIPAIIIAYLVGSWPLALFTLALYILIQQLENHLIVPQVMRAAVGINPVITILIMLTGFKLAGVSGAILAIPVYIVLQATLTEWYHFKKLK